jgi:hypothetical protein
VFARELGLCVMTKTLGVNPIGNRQLTLGNRLTHPLPAWWY